MTAGPAESGPILEDRTADAADLLGPWPLPSDRERARLAVCHVLHGPELVLGSAQPGRSLRRPSGGGAVLVAPDSQVWIEVWVPRRHWLWDEDVVRSSWWLGEAWADVLGRLGAGPGPVEVHRGRLEARPWSDLVCFAGLGPGEVTVGGRKVVGLSQRRDRHGARFQTTAAVAWDPGPTVAGLVRSGLLESSRAADATAGLVPVASGLREVLPGRPDSSDAALLQSVEAEVAATTMRRLG